jgi:UDP-N-acetylglucosamine--N-acetylmuramyl-(pentapeptide) pyrophosphoryl-undecaprenol N-acetylglucosamine transferase
MVPLVLENPGVRMAFKKGSKIRLLLTGGGTGGHVYPLLAIRRILCDELGVSDTLYVGSRGRAEEEIVSRAGIPIRFVSSAPVSGLSPLKLVSSLGRIVLGTLQAFYILAKFRPHLILASGGYVSAPVTFASFLLRPLLRIPLVIDEQNVMPGLMNKVASLFAQVVIVSFPETPYFLWNNRCVYAGYPVRKELLESRNDGARDRLGIPGLCTTVLVYGGSLGARSINRLMTSIASELAGTGQEIHFIHSTGLSKGEYCAWDETSADLKRRCPEGTVFQEHEGEIDAYLPGGRVVYRLRRYLHEIAACLEAADIVICRAGAGAITEICAAGKASIVIPKRGLPGDHQEHNAILLAESDACEVVFEQRGPDGIDAIDSREFFPILARLLADPARRAKLAAKARGKFKGGFASIITETVEDVLEGKEADYVSNVVEPGSVQILKQMDRLVGFLRKQPPGSFYRRLYSIKMDEYLASADWSVVNNGIKLVGALSRADRLPALQRAFKKGNGFMRRNVLRALEQLDIWCPEVPEFLSAALRDPYFEVRAAGFSLAGKYARHLAGNAEVVGMMKSAMTRRWQHYDVRLEGLRVLPLFMPIEEYLRLAGPYRFARNTRLRQAILEGLRSALRNGVISGKDITMARRFIREMLITTSDFRPQFSIRDSYVQLYRGLTDKDKTLGGGHD